jgi:hypothetical protein
VVEGRTEVHFRYGDFTLLAERLGDCAPIDIREARPKGGGCMLAAVLKITNCLQRSNTVSWIYCLKLNRIPCTAQTNAYTVSTGALYAQSLCLSKDDPVPARTLTDSFVSDRAL